MTDTLLAIDLGKTGCRAALWVDGVRSDAEGPGAPGLGAPDGLAAAERAIAAVAGPLLDAAGLDRVDRACVGAAGALAAPDIAAALAASLPALERAVTSDAVASHAGALAGDGLVLAIGTGSVALAIAAGQTRRADGWGPLLGDEGSGAWIGLEGLRAALRAAEGRGPATTLGDAALGRFGSLDALPARVTGATEAARFAPDVARAADSGDPVAIAILHDAASRLASTARSAAAMLPPGSRCAVIGGLVNLGPALMQPLGRLLAEAGLIVVPARGTALDGARLLAERRDLPHETLVSRHHAARAAPARAAGLDRLQTEQVRPGLDDLDQLEPGAVARLAIEAEIAARDALLRAAPQVAAAADAIAACLRGGGRLFYLGAGTPGRLGVLDAAELGPTYSAPEGLVIPILAGGMPALLHAAEGAEDDHDAAAATLDAHGLCSADAVVGIAASGRTPFVIGGLAHARQSGALTIAVVNNPASPCAAAAELAIEVLTGPELIAGSTRMLAGTSQKIVLNALSTSAMVALGKTYGARMVEVRATNEKLRRRAIRIVRDITGADDEAANRALAKADGSVKLATLMLLASVDAPEAESRLQTAGGSIRRALSLRHV